MRAHPAGPRHAELLADHGVGAPPADLGGLDPAIWPAGVGRDPSSGALTLHGIDVRGLAAEHGTPAMLLDEVDVRGRARAYTEAFAGADVYYAARRSCRTAVARWVVEEGLGLDVCTGGELAVALRAGVPGERLALHGNNKSVRRARRRRSTPASRTVVVDSFDGDRAARSRSPRGAGCGSACCVRVTVGVEAHTHEFIATAHEDQKFGFSLAGGDAAEAVRRDPARAVAASWSGCTRHIGSQIFDTAGFEVAAHRVRRAAGARSATSTASSLPELDLGGGLGIAYVAEDDPPSRSDRGRASCAAIVARECARGRPARAAARRSSRGGRSSGPAAITALRGGHGQARRARRRRSRTYVSVDGGMSDNIRTALYDAEYTVRAGLARLDGAARCWPASSASTARAATSSCATPGCPATSRPATCSRWPATGAYCRVDGEQLQPRRPPAGGGRRRRRAPAVIVRRETVDDLLATDLG